MTKRFASDIWLSAESFCGKHSERVSVGPKAMPGYRTSPLAYERWDADAVCNVV